MHATGEGEEMLQHQYKEPKDCNCDGQPGCNICEGGLSVCKVCGLFEGALTTECPGEPSMKYSDQVYKGEIDFFNGAWVEGLQNPTNHSWNVGIACDLQRTAERLGSDPKKGLEAVGVDPKTIHIGQPGKFLIGEEFNAVVRVLERAAITVERSVTESRILHEMVVNAPLKIPQQVLNVAEAVVAQVEITMKLFESMGIDIPLVARPTVMCLAERIDELKQALDNAHPHNSTVRL